MFYKHDTRFFFIRRLKFKKVCIIMFGSMLLVFISNRMILSAINEKITSHKEKVPKSYRVSKDEERFSLIFE